MYLTCQICGSSLWTKDMGQDKKYLYYYCVSCDYSQRIRKSTKKDDNKNGE